LIYHVLSREAEAMVLPNLPMFVAGTYQPTDNAERLALTGICQAKGLRLAAARLYADAFAADPALADDLSTGLRYNAARAAAVAGCGAGDGAALDDTERSRWREQARRWIRADLGAWAKLVDSGEPERRRTMRRDVQPRLTRWQADPDLVGLRDPRALAELPGAEQMQCLALWDEVTVVLRRARAIE
jgi:serine/threonine-protein kinase